MIAETNFPAAEHVTGYRNVKAKVKNVLCSVTYCGICLETEGDLCNLEVPIISNTTGGDRILSLISLKNIVNEVLRNQAEHVLSSNKICIKCKEDAVKAYNFIENAKQVSNTLQEYLRQIESKLNEISDRVIDPNASTIIQLSDPVEKKESNTVKTEPEDYENDGIYFEDIDYTPPAKKPKKRKQGSKNTNKTIYKCETCLKIYFKKFQLEYHLKHHMCFKNNTEEPPKNIYESVVQASKCTYTCYKCTICNISFKTKDEISNHVKKHQLSPKDKVPIKKIYKYPKRAYKYICEHCKKVFYKKKDLQEHLQVVHEETNPSCKLTRSSKRTRITPVFKYKCDVCNKKFCRKFQYVYHLELEHNNDEHAIPQMLKNKKIFACPNCKNEECPHKKYLLSYKAQILSGEWRVACTDCDYVCWSKDAFIAHVNKEHLKLFYMICEHCGKPLHSQKAYDRHIALLHTEVYTCEYCDTEYHHKTRFENHRVWCKTVDRPFKCVKCPASFNEEEKLKPHMKKHGDKKYPCNLCAKICYTVAAFKRHTLSHIEGNTSHQRNREYLCYKCSKTFPTLKDRNYHMLSHGRDEKYICVKCNISVDTFRELKLHRKKCPRRNHFFDQSGELTKKEKKITSLKCPLCEYQTRSNNTLEGHMNRYHYGITPFECTLCKKKYVSQHTLTSHIKTHTKSTDWQCELCGVYLCTKAALQKHNRRHTGDKTYQCDMCEERFVCPSQRKKHKLREHSGKNIHCPLCDSMFYAISNLRNHVKKVHWKFKGEKFDYTRLAGLKEEDHALFVDRRMVVVENVEVVGKIV